MYGGIVAASACEDLHRADDHGEKESAMSECPSGNKSPQYE